MDFGVTVPNVHRPMGREAIREVALAAEALGFDSVYMADHIAYPLEGGGWGRDMFSGDLYEPLTTAGYVAALTKRVKIGFGVVVIPWRGCVMQAKIMATLDNLSEGRMIYGVGLGPGAGPEAHAMGVNTKVRGRMATEYIKAFRVLWSNERPEFHGEFVDFEGIQFRPLPIQNPLPIWWGGGSEAAVRRVVESCEGWIGHSTGEHLKPEIDKFREEAAKQGRDFATIAIANQPPIRFADRPMTDRDFYPRDAKSTPNLPIIGPPDYIAEQLNRMAEDGVTHLRGDIHIQSWRYNDPLPVTLKALETFAVKVMPQVTASRKEGYHLASVTRLSPGTGSLTQK